MFIPIGDDIEREAAPFPFLTIIFVSASVFVFGWQLTLPFEQWWDEIVPFTLIPGWLMGNATVSEDMIVIPAELTLFTSMFLHADWSHLIGNMVMLWVFGSSVEEATGHFKFIFLYLICGLAAGFGHVMADPNSIVPTLGASGAISGVMGAYVMVYPWNRVKILAMLPHFVTFRVPSLLFIGGWIALQCWSILAAAGAPEGAGGGGVAWTAHVAGFMSGVFLIVVLRRRGVKLLSEPEVAV